MVAAVVLGRGRSLGWIFPTVVLLVHSDYYYCQEVDRVLASWYHHSMMTTNVAVAGGVMVRVTAAAAGAKPPPPGSSETRFWTGPFHHEDNPVNKQLEKKNQGLF